MAAILEIDGLVKRFPISGSSKTVNALNGISLKLEAGTTLALVGESGSGKTTVGRCITGLVPATAGTITFDGKPMDSRRDIRSRDVRGQIQLVFQEPAEALDPRMRVGETLGEPLVYAGMNRADRDRRVAETARLVGLTPAQLDKLPSELSAGFQQRIGIGRAIATRPRLIVLDEPTSALDPTSRAEIVDLLIRLQRELGTVYLFISHDLSTVRHISDRVAVLYLGSIVEIGSANSVFAAPRHPYSAALLASALLPHPSLVATQSVVLDGEIPSPIDLPPGCPLASRCPFVEARCTTGAPPARQIDHGHFAFCINTEKVAALNAKVDLFDDFQVIANRVLGERGGPIGTPELAGARADAL